MVFFVIAILLLVVGYRFLLRDTRRQGYSHGDQLPHRGDGSTQRRGDTPCSYTGDDHPAALEAVSQVAGDGRERTVCPWEGRCYQPQRDICRNDLLPQEGKHRVEAEPGQIVKCQSARKQNNQNPFLPGGRDHGILHQTCAGTHLDTNFARGSTGTSVHRPVSTER